MKLLTKFNFILLVLFAMGGLIISQVIYSFLIGNAQREVFQQAQLMMASAMSVRDYTTSDLGPLLEQNPEHKKRFLPETVPAFSAMSTFSKLRQNYPDYTYREATLNPTNPEHRATDWERDIIECPHSSPRIRLPELPSRHKGSRCSGRRFHIHSFPSVNFLPLGRV